MLMVSKTVEHLLLKEMLNRLNCVLDQVVESGVEMMEEIINFMEKLSISDYMINFYLLKKLATYITTEIELDSAINAIRHAKTVTGKKI